jgi:hypothetical protein
MMVLLVEEVVLRRRVQGRLHRLRKFYEPRRRWKKVT